jgi:hypothetical protein
VMLEKHGFTPASPRRSSHARSHPRPVSTRRRGGEVHWRSRAPRYMRSDRHAPALQTADRNARQEDGVVGPRRGSVDSGTSVRIVRTSASVSEAALPRRSSPCEYS